MLHVVEHSAVGHRGRKGRHLQRRRANSFAEARHPADAHFVLDLRQHARLFPRNFVAGLFPKAETLRPLAEPGETQSFAQVIEQDVI